MTKNKLLKNISWLFFDKIIRILGGLFVGVWVARYLGPNDFGILNYAMAYTAFFILFVKLGLDKIIIREIVIKPKLTDYLLGTAFALKLAGSVVAIISIYISFYFIDTDTVTKIAIFIVSAGFILQSIDVIDYFYQSQVLSKYVVIARNSAFILSSLLKVYFIVNKYSVLYFVLAGTIDLVFAGIFLTIIYKKTGGKILKWKFSKKIAIKLLKSSWPLALSSFLIAIYMKIDQVMIGNMLDAEQLGVYSVAVRLSEFWLFMPTIIISTFMPYFIKLREMDKQFYYQRLMQLYSFMFWMGIFVGTVTFIYGKVIITLLYGEAYSGAYSALVFNIWSGAAISQGFARGIWLIGEDLQKYRLYGNIIAVLLNVLLNIILIPKYGIAGAAIATLLTQSLGPWVFSFLWKPLRASTWAMIKSMNPKYLISTRKK